MTATDLQDEVVGPFVFEEYREQRSKRMKSDQFMRKITIYSSSIIQDFESFFGTQFDLIEVDIRLVLQEYSSKFITFELPKGIYTFKDLSQTLVRVLQPEYQGYHNAVYIELDDITMKSNWL